MIFTNILQKWNNTSLVLRILGGLIIGVILALLVPQFDLISLLGVLFIGALKGIAPILVFVLVISALANGKGHGKSIARVVAMYVIGTLAAAVTAVTIFFFFPVGLSLNGVEAASGYEVAGDVGAVFLGIIKDIVINPLAAITNTNFLGILFWAVVFGLALRKSSDKTKYVISEIADAVSVVVKWIISFAPFGVLGIVFNAVSTNGLEIFVNYGQLLALLVGTMAIVALVINPLIVFVMIRQNPYPLVLKCLKESFIPAFFTRSSGANIPVNMNLCKSLKLNPNIYSTTIPLGATINMAGAAITVTIMTLACVYTLGIQTPFYMQILLCFVAALCACGASGVAGGSLLLIPLACSLFGVPVEISMQVVGIGFIIGVVQDSCETGLNSSTDAIFTAASEYHDWKKEGKEISWK
ncbi:MAG TPA: serine/threonine transporter SstT [Methanocorpusculum sp.]|nr:serine/threonine transporter SstT [Methanocorpusculum sp.]